MPSGEKVPKLIPGPTASAMSKRLGVWSFAVVGVLLTMPVISFVPDRDLRVALLAIVAVVLSVMAPYVFLYQVRKWLLRVREEIDAGYTTMGDRGLDYWQLDPQTGEPVRRPGERQRFR